MLRTVSIGDTHGNDVADIVSGIVEDYDKIIFAGDYVDSFGLDDSVIRKSLTDIIGLKQRYADKIVLLWGNHDIQYYLGFMKYGCSGYRPEMQKVLYELFHLNTDLFQLSFQSDGWLWTHAGITNEWYNDRFRPFIESHPHIDSVSDLLNLAFSERYPALFDVGFIRGGRYKTGGPLWCDITELTSDPFTEFHQIAGHNRVRKFHSFLKNGKELTFIDILENEEIISKTSFYYKDIPVR
jgi:hypothetical protein